MFSTSKELPSPASSSPNVYRIRRRRFSLVFILVFVLGVVFFTPSSFWELSKGLGRASDLGGSDLDFLVGDNSKEDSKDHNDNMASTDTELPSLSPLEELKLLLHMVASTELRIPKDVDPTKPLARDVYDAGIGGGIGGGISWLQAQQADPPVIVFSKTYCPYSTKAKATLKSFNLSPPPKIVEVDKREDSELLKAILTRLTGRATFPNIFIQGHSIGGSDDLQALVDQDQLVSLFAEAGVSFSPSSDQATT